MEKYFWSKISLSIFMNLKRISLNQSSFSNGKEKQNQKLMLLSRTIFFILEPEMNALEQHFTVKAFVKFINHWMSKTKSVLGIEMKVKSLEARHKKNAVPSHEKGMPIIGPACFINSGHNKPSSNDKTVPDTAPTAKKIATPFDQALVMSR